MYVIGVTGPMGAGKSVVLAALEALGAATLRADDASRELLAPGARLVTTIREAMGDGVFRPDGALDRARAAALIFADEQARARLEAIMHPAMVEWLTRELDRLRRAADPPGIVAVEAAILTHMGARPLVDAVLRVHAPFEECLARLRARDGLTPEQARARLALHERLGLFSEPADFVLDTSGTPEDTRRRVRDLWPELLRAAARADAGRAPESS